jgi:hypothetical protein
MPSDARVHLGRFKGSEAPLTEFVGSIPPPVIPSHKQSNGETAVSSEDGASDHLPSDSPSSEVADQILSSIIDRISAADTGSLGVHSTLRMGADAANHAVLTAERREALIAEEKWLETSIRDRVKVRFHDACSDNCVIITRIRGR